MPNSPKTITPPHKKNTHSKTLTKITVSIALATLPLSAFLIPKPFLIENLLPNYQKIDPETAEFLAENFKISLAIIFSLANAVFFFDQVFKSFEASITISTAASILATPSLQSAIHSTLMDKSLLKIITHQIPIKDEKELYPKSRFTVINPKSERVLVTKKTSKKLKQKTEKP